MDGIERIMSQDGGRKICWQLITAAVPWGYAENFSVIVVPDADLLTCEHHNAEVEQMWLWEAVTKNLAVFLSAGYMQVLSPRMQSRLRRMWIAKGDFCKGYTDSADPRKHDCKHLQQV